jgi:hypothetical protein
MVAAYAGGRNSQNFAKKIGLKSREEEICF